MANELILHFLKQRKSANEIKFEDIPSTTAETSGYFDRTDYSTFFMSFVKAFEETVGLGKLQTR